jgi:hypothetical protein
MLFAKRNLHSTAPRAPATAVHIAPQPAPAAHPGRVLRPPHPGRQLSLFAPRETPARPAFAQRLDSGTE